MKHFRLWWLILLILLLTSCQMQDAYSGKIILSGVHELPAGKTLDGSLVLLGGAFVQQPGSTITGPVHIFAGEADLNGEVAGSVTLLDGLLRIDAGAFLHSDLTVLGGALDLSHGAQIAGKQTVRTPASQKPAPIPVPPVAGRFAHLLIEIPLLVLVGSLAARFYPVQVRTIREALFRHTLVCSATGLLAGVAGLSLAILMTYTLLLVPASTLLLGLMLFATTFGAVPAALALGNWVYRRFQFKQPTATRATALGMILFAFLAELLHFIPAAGDLLVIALLLTALGASLLTRFGGQLFVPAAQGENLRSPEG